MSKKADDAVDRLKAAGRADPTVAAVAELGEAFAATVAGLRESQAADKEEVTEEVKTVGREVREFKAAVEAGMEHQRDRLDLIERRVTKIRIGGPDDPTFKLLAAIPEEHKGMFSLCERVKSDADGGRFAEPSFKAATALWFWYSTFAQNPRLESALRQKLADRNFNVRESFDKLDRAFSESFGYESKVVGIFGTSPDGLGGHLLPDPVEAELNRLIKDNSVMRQAGVRVIPMQTKTLDLPLRGTDAMTVGIGTEGSAIADSVGDPGTSTLAKLTLTAKRFEGYAVSSIEVIQDSPLSILAWVQQELTELIAALEDTQALEGTGAGVNFTGVNSASGVNTISATGANGDPITFGKLSSVPYAARSRTTRRLARWFMAPEAMSKVVGLRADSGFAADDGKGLPIFMFGNVPNGIPPTILGFPNEVHDGISITRTKGASGATLTNIYFGPPQTIVFGDRTGMSWDTSDAPGFKSYQLAMRLIKRTAIGVALPAAWVRVIDLTR